MATATADAPATGLITTAGKPAASGTPTTKTKSGKIVYQDASGNAISKETYDLLLARFPSSKSTTPSASQQAAANAIALINAGINPLVAMPAAAPTASPVGSKKALLWIGGGAGALVLIWFLVRRSLKKKRASR